MIIIVNNSCKPIGKTIRNLKIKYIIEELIGKQNVMIIDDTEDIIRVISKKNIRNKIKGIILTGSELRINDKMYVGKIMNNLLPILEFNVPILGICFGYQILCSLYKGEFNSFNVMRMGDKPIKLSNNELFVDVPKKSELYVAHYDYTTNVPTLFKSIAVDKHGINHGIKHKFKPMYGLLFHPEFSNSKKNIGITIFKNFLKICSIKFDNDVEYSDIKEVKHPNGPFDFLSIFK
tara:strand:+ start:169 stop:870 length:702 start_codon:yes stop_codon:yes gene_type:complete